MVKSIFGKCTFFAALGVVSCAGADTGKGDPTVSTTAVSVDMSTQSLQWSDGSTLAPIALKGNYGKGCAINGGQSWALTLDDPGHSGVQVALNDELSDCKLQVTAITTQMGTGSHAQRHDFALVQPITLGVGFASQASKAMWMGELGYYANLELQGPGLSGYSPQYKANFVIELVFSDLESACGVNAPPATYATVSAKGESDQVNAPSYDLRFDDLSLKVDEDQKVQASLSSGHVELMPAGQTGEEWRIFDKQLPSCCRSVTFADIDQLYTRDLAVSAGAIPSGRTPQMVMIDWSKFDLAGSQLPVTRTLVVKHTGDGKVTSYELFQINFPRATHQ